jgi:hypothetical protein
MPDTSRLEVGSPPLEGWAPKIARLLGLAATLGLVACSMGDEPLRLHTTHPPPVSSGSITVEARQPLLPMYPCSRCHASRTPNTEERVLKELHTQKVLNHGTQQGWCYRCHSKDNIDKLHLGDGTLVSFDEAYELCGSCHGDKLRDWQAGIHGLTTGFWLGDRLRRSCPNCHDPHSPKFPLMTPERAPARPRTVPADSPHGEHEKSNGEAH